MKLMSKISERLNLFKGGNKIQALQQSHSNMKINDTHT